MGIGASTSSAYRFLRKRRLALYRSIASSNKAPGCFGMKTAATKAMVEIALEMDTEQAAKLTALTEGLRLDEARKREELKAIVRTGRLKLAHMKNNPAAMRNAGSDPAFLAFFEQYRAKNEECARVHTQLVLKRKALGDIQGRISNWSGVLRLHELDDSDYNATELINITAEYVENRPLTLSADVGQEASARLVGALDASNPFDVDESAGDNSNTEIAKMLKMLFSAGDAAAAPAYAEGAAVMGGSSAVLADDDDFLTFRAEREMAATAAPKKGRNNFNPDTAVWG